MDNKPRPDQAPPAGAWSNPQHNAGRDTAAAACIRVVGDPGGELITLGVFRQSLVLKAAAILAVASSIAGLLSILWGIHAINVVVKDFLVGAIYAMSLGGALLLSGKLDTKRTILIGATIVAAISWNVLFHHILPLVACIIFLELWLPVYWILTSPADMQALGLEKKGLFINVLAGLILAGALASYIAWGMKNYGFTLNIEPWRLIVNSAGVFPMYLAVFCLFFMVWNRLKAWGVSTTRTLLAITIMSVAISAPSFLCVAVAVNMPPGTAIAGFIASTVIMILSTHLTFGRFRSVIPAACLFTAIADLLLIIGLS